jgi:hypothetical protein
VEPCADLFLRMEGQHRFRRMPTTTPDGPPSVSDLRSVNLLSTAFPAGTQCQFPAWNPISTVPPTAGIVSAHPAVETMQRRARVS